MTGAKNAQFDAIVAGTGPGGATVARELSRMNKRVLMLEMGSKPVIKGSGLQTLRAMRMEVTDSNMPIVRQVTTGGSTFSYCATAMEPNHEAFLQHGIDLRPATEEARREIPIAPVSDQLMGPMAKRIMDAALDLGYKWHKLDKFIDQSKCRPGCWRCWYACPWGAKWNARMFVEEAEANGATLVNGAQVTKAIIEGNKAVGIEYIHKGQKLTAMAPVVVISAGGIGTPAILRATGIKEAGYNFFFDPLALVIGTVNGAKGGLAEIPMTGGMDFEEEGFFLMDITVTAALHMAMAAAAFNPAEFIGGKKALHVMVKIKDELGGGLPTGKGKINKSMGASEEKAFKHGFEHARKILQKAGAKHIMMSPKAGAHPGGTAKIGEIVDKNLQTRFENLYVCDASVYPGRCGVPPVLTLIALGKYLGKQLNSQ